MKYNDPYTLPQFGVKQFLKAAIPSYVAPLISPGLPAYFLNKQELLQASYSSIALSSLIATILSFIILSQFQKRQVLLFNRFKMTAILGLSMVIVAVLVVIFLGLQSSASNIVPSVFIGAAIVALTNPLKKNEYKREYE